MKRRVLVVDIGGTHVKLLMSRRNHREFASGPRMGPKQLIAKLKGTTRGWKFDVASIGFPAPVRKGRIAGNPKHLGKGWVGFNFAKALGVPIRLVNDAAMQALGSYHSRGRMLFPGLGTGLGSALVWERNLMPLELGDLPYHDGRIIENYLGVPGFALLGGKKWKREVIYAVAQLKRSFIADYVVLGGGNVGRFDKLPKDVEPGKNENAFLGGLRLWETKMLSRELKWRVIQAPTVYTRLKVPGRGLEPLRISPPDPKSGASANFATLANRFSTLDFRFAIARSTPSRLTETKPFIVFVV
jgi:predicted NBD/HSP70 family sugar kinase